MTGLEKGSLINFECDIEMNKFIKVGFLDTNSLFVPT